MWCVFIGLVDYMCLSPLLVSLVLCISPNFELIVDVARVGILKVNLLIGNPTASE